MAISVYTNVPSLNAQRNLSTSGAALGTALKRLSSGLRINSAADDAAGLSISNGLTSQVKGLNQAVRNAGDGLSLLGTAEGAMSEQTNLLQRMRELAVQASSDTNSASNRSSLNNEATQLKNELDRIAKTVEFNGIKLLDGTFTAKDLQVGAMSTANDRIQIDIQSTRSSSIGSAYKSGGSLAATNAALAYGDVTLNVGGTVYTVGASATDGVSTAENTASALAKANAINAISGQTNVKAEASTSYQGGAQTAGTVAGDGTDYIKINGVDIGSVTTTSVSDQSLVNAINSKANQTGVTAAMDMTNNKITLTASDGRNIDVAAGGTGLTVSAMTAGVKRGTVTLRSSNSFTVGGSNVAFAGLAAGQATFASSENIQALDLTTKAGAQLAIKIVDVAISNVDDRRAAIGALTNRLTTTISNLNSASENASASNSRIMDADFAQETAAMSRSQILQQAGVAVLSQANQGPQLALSLLR